MKNKISDRTTTVLRLAMSLGLLLLSGYNAGAQVATLDSKKVLASIPMLASLDSLVLQEQQRYVQEYAKMRYATQLALGRADSLYRVRPADSLTLLAQAGAARQNQALQAYEKTAADKVAGYRNLLYLPYLEKVNTAIKTTALRLKYRQVLDIQQVPFVYADPAADITAEVIAELRK